MVDPVTASAYRFAYTHGLVIILESTQQKCENTPMKQIVCEFGTAKQIANFDTCLCTHIAIPVSLESEKDDETPGKNEKKKKKRFKTSS